jgi:hypothetical protein
MARTVSRFEMIERAPGLERVLQLVDRRDLLLGAVAPATDLCR